MNKAALLDTSFFIRLLKENDPLFKNVNDYFKFFLKNEITLYVSTISIAEYCVKGRIDELPLKNLRVLPFNIDHAIIAGQFANILYEKRKKDNLISIERPLVINDAKLFAQAHNEPQINYYCSSDERSFQLYEVINNELNSKLKFQFINLREPYSKVFGLLDFKS